MTTNTNVQTKAARRKLNLLELAGELENISKAFKIMGYSRLNLYESIDEMQTDLDIYLYHYNNERAHQGRNMNGRTPYQVFIDGIKIDDTDLNSAT